MHVTPHPPVMFMPLFCPACRPKWLPRPPLTSRAPRWRRPAAPRWWPWALAPMTCTAPHPAHWYVHDLTWHTWNCPGWQNDGRRIVQDCLNDGRGIVPKGNCPWFMLYTCYVTAWCLQWLCYRNILWICLQFDFMLYCPVIKWLTGMQCLLCPCVCVYVWMYVYLHHALVNFVITSVK